MSAYGRKVIFYKCSMSAAGFKSRLLIS